MQYYRYTIQDIGIIKAWTFYFNPRKDHLHKGYLELQNSIKWLPLPKLGNISKFKNRSLQSYFTEKGKLVFDKTTIPLVKKYMPHYDIELQTYDIKDVLGEIIYEDEYQIVTIGPYGSR